MKKVYILTNFGQWLPAYSPIIVVGEQLKMFKRNGYNPVLIASEGWDAPQDSIFSQVETKRITAAHVYNDPKEFSDTDVEEIDALYRELSEIIEDDSVVITHDLIFLPDYVKHNVAARKVAADKPSVSWLHWVHSATSPGALIRERAMYGEKYKELLNDKFPNSAIAFPNAASIPRVAVNFGYEEDEVFEVPHSTDLPTKWQLDQRVVKLFDDKDIWSDDVIMVYPCRLDRGKNVDACVRLLAGLGEVGLASRLIVCDFHSTGDDKVVYREDLKQLAEQLGCATRLVFMSEQDESLKLESPYKVVSDLFRLSNVMLMPSKSETYSLVAQEALADGNLLIMNRDFQPFMQIYGNHAIYRQVGGANVGFDGYDGETNVEYSDIDAFYRQMAHNVRYHLTNNKVMSGKTWVRKERNPDAIFRNYLEPLLYRNKNE